MKCGSTVNNRAGTPDALLAFSVCHSLSVTISSYEKDSMQPVLRTWFTAAKEQSVGSKRQVAVWTAYTEKGKIVVIQGDRVIKVVDPDKTALQPRRK